jgi:DNA polymerase-3 subunit gamma/tau
MAYQVLARKWRPQTFEAVVGQDAITRTLRNALVSSRIAHAYLFAGPRGIGKTTTARLLAKALLCPERVGPEPCGACAACCEMQAGAAVDVIEIDGASNRKIDDVRALRDNVKYAPARGRFKVYIIDEVHQLTPEAFDALLKTLEEPPSHVVFILATTDPRELPLTILSRVQRFDFKPIPPETVVASLARVLTEEAVAFDAAALPIIARASEGSLRDAFSLLDTVLAYGGGTVEAEAAAQLFGMTAPAEVRRFAAALIAHDAAAGLEAIDRAGREGEDFGVLARETIELLRRVMVLKAAPASRLAGLPPAEANELRELAEAVSLDELLYLLRAFLDADAQMRESPHPRVELEIAAVRAARRPVPPALEEILRRVDEAEARVRKGALSRAGAGGPTIQPDLGFGSHPSPVAPESGEKRDRPGPGRSTARAAAERQGPSRIEPRQSPDRTAAGQTATPEASGSPPASASPDLATGWGRVVEEVTRLKPMLGAVVNQAVPAELAEGRLTIRLGGNHFHQELLADRANREIVVQAARRHITGATRIEVARDDGGPSGVEQHPVVQAALAEFGGQIVAVRPRTSEGEDQ